MVSSTASHKIGSGAVAAPVRIGSRALGALIGAFFAAGLLLAGTEAMAKLPQAPETEESKARAAETKEKAAQAAKKSAEQLGKAQDRAVENYQSNRPK